jgi:hypothetical protein
VNDQWTSGGLPIDNEWDPSCGCTPSGGSNSTVDNITISGSPGAITSRQNDLAQWSLVLNDGTAEADFRIDRFDNSGRLVDSPMSIVRATGVVTFADPVMLEADPLEELEAATKHYVDTRAAGVTEAPEDGQAYARRSLTWSTITSDDITDWDAAIAASTSQFLTDAPTDGTLYGRASGAWGAAYEASNPANYQSAAQVAAAVATRMPLAGGTFTGPVTFNSNAIFASVGNLNVYGGTAGQVLGATATPGILAWATPSPFPEAPTDGAQYARQMSAWSPVAAGPAPSTTLPLANGVAAVGTATTYARADHVHPASAGENRIINGDMRIDQRNNHAQGSANAYTCDRWGFAATQTGKGTWQSAASAGAAQLGFPYVWYWQTPAVPYAPLLASDSFSLFQIVEADMLNDFLWGTANAQPATLSFWVYCPTGGTYSGAICNQPSPPTRSYPFTFTVSGGVLTKIVVTIPGDTAGTWVTSGNAGGLVVRFDLGSGVTLRGAAGAWASANYVGATGAISIVSLASGVFQITGVKLELGSVATPFNRQTMAKSLADCQRYYWQTLSGFLLFESWNATGAVGHNQSQNPVPMRAAPTCTPSGMVYSNCSALTVSAVDTLFWRMLCTTTTNGLAFCNFFMTANAEL